MFKLSILFSLVVFLHVGNTVAREKWSANPRIIKDTLDSSIPDGKIKFIGTVLNSAGQSVPDFNIKVTNSALQKINWDNSGSFEILVDTNFTFISFTSPNHVTVQLNNSGFENQHEITISTIMQMNSIIPTLQPEMEIMTYKPVIYLYGPDLDNIELLLNPSGKFTFTYPQIKESKWTVDLKDNKILASGQAFPYLFYETVNEDLHYKLDKGSLFGHVSEKNEVIDFLETSLSEMGLTQKEQTDFITFWAPRMITSPKVFIQFWIDKEYDNIATLEVSPHPESSKRIYIVFSPIEDDNEINYQEQEFKPFKRKGFTIIEWGGSQLPISKLKI